eukprot:2709962-Rhodomonas_salina.4
MLVRVTVPFSLADRRLRLSSTQVRLPSSEYPLRSSLAKGRSPTSRDCRRVRTGPKVDRGPRRCALRLAGGLLPCANFSLAPPRQHRTTLRVALALPLAYATPHSAARPAVANLEMTALQGA